MPVSHMYTRPWEEFFTVVHWDQRGAGKTYAANDPEKIRPTMTVERMLADAEELTAYLRKRYAKDKIVLLGHSWAPCSARCSRRSIPTGSTLTWA